MRLSFVTPSSTITSPFLCCTLYQHMFAWIEKNRRPWKNCERWLNTSLQFLHLAFLVILLKRL